MTGECVHVIEGHKGRGIWSMCINRNNNKVVRLEVQVYIMFQVMLIW